ncbi:hypothetical protein [Rhodoplanes sp. Z2-YC6860]|uniref:hypothetical protein n=1 Tax=Rhodoplanes sp. Z2-YC6860 TaxID=674703 RepID=UPI0012ED54EF|nr:hypothetical protein [Rhodoplanes sp. Z2-YC6860]
MAKEPITPPTPNPAEPSKRPIEYPQPDVQPEREPPSHPQEDRPLHDPMPPDTDKPQM